MTDWPDDWFRDTPHAGAAQPGSGPDAGARPGQETAAPRGRALAGPVTSPGQAGRRGPGQPGPAGRSGRPGGPGGPGGPDGGWPSQPAARTRNRAGRGPALPTQAGGAGAGGGYPGGGYPGGGFGGGPGLGRRRWLRPRPIIAALAVLVCAAIIGSLLTYFYMDSKLTRKNILVDYASRPTPGAGQNWLITGSDSRQGLTSAQERKLATGRDISGRRSDTIMVLHLPANGGRPALVSLPRDSYVPIPGHGSDKINAAYAFGGPKLLAETVQNITGLRIDHYMGIGFGGFVRVVDAIGGVRICLKAPLVDPNAGLHLHKGCQVLDGAEGLGFVRSRENYATQDLQRIQNQRLFLSALLRKLTSTGVLANPFAVLPAASGVAGTLTVDKGTHLYQLLQVAFALRSPITTTVPIGGSYSTPSGQAALLWNHDEALTLFRDLRNDRPVPKSLISGSKLAG